MTDISSRTDIALLVSRFYEKVKQDDLIGAFFAKVNWEKHLPVMNDFWENAIFYTGTYNGNPLQTHKAMHNLVHLQEVHFNRWLSIFQTTVDEMYSGEKASLIKRRANSIATVMQIKILGNTKKED